MVIASFALSSPALKHLCASHETYVSAENSWLERKPTNLKWWYSLVNIDQKMNHKKKQIRNPRNSQLTCLSSNIRNVDLWIWYQWCFCYQWYQVKKETSASGDSERWETIAAPADSPTIVTLAGLPPKEAMLAWTHLAKTAVLCTTSFKLSNFKQWHWV